MRHWCYSSHSGGTWRCAIQASALSDNRRDSASYQALNEKGTISDKRQQNKRTLLHNRIWGADHHKIDTYSKYTLPLTVVKNVPEPLCLYGAFTTELTFEDCVQHKLVDTALQPAQLQVPQINHIKEKEHVPEPKNIVQDKNTDLVMPMYALRDIHEGEELV